MGRVFFQPSVVCHCYCFLAEMGSGPAENFCVVTLQTPLKFLGPNLYGDQIWGRWEAGKVCSQDILGSRAKGLTGGCPWTSPQPGSRKIGSGMGFQCGTESGKGRDSISRSCNSHEKFLMQFSKSTKSSTNAMVIISSMGLCVVELSLK